MLRKFVLFAVSSLIMLSGIVAIDIHPLHSQAATHKNVSSIFTRKMSRASSGHMVAVPSGTHILPIPARGPELAGNGARHMAGIKTRAVLHPQSGGALPPPTGTTWQRPSGPQLSVSFDGITARQQRLANNGNQFTIEPPDQGLCVGNGYVMETINSALNIYNARGQSLLGVLDHNTFYSYPPEIVRTPHPIFGPETTDPSCYFDHGTNRWFHVVLTLDTNRNTGALTGTNHLDIAVSQTPNPLRGWVIYRLPVQDDGTQGTPNHDCGGPCLGDYPHIGADANGFYITTNEYSFFGTGFHAAQIYAFSKQALAANLPTIAVTQIDTKGMVLGHPGFTVWPATSPDGLFDYMHNGTEYFLSSDAVPEAGGSGTSNHLIIWSLSNTSSLNTARAQLLLQNAIQIIKRYSVPPISTQKAGAFPLGQCLNIASCAKALNGAPNPYAPEHEGGLDSNDTRMQQVTYVNGLLWGALDTAMRVNGVNEAGIEWFVVRPYQTATGTRALLVNNGYYAAVGANLIYPAIGITSFGKGVMAFTLSGPNNYPSAAYAAIDADGVGSIHIAVAGKGPQDGFSEYRYYGIAGVARPRWGDYGAAVPIGNIIWIGSEYSGQSCNLQQYLSNTARSPLYSCDQTRVALGNWYTRLSRIILS